MALDWSIEVDYEKRRGKMPNGFSPFPSGLPTVFPP